MSQDFLKAKIYKITNDYNNDIYVGSTCNTLSKRFSMHKADSKKELLKNRPLYKLINDIGFERFRIDLIEDYTCKDKYELRQKEGQYIRQWGTLNKVIEGRTKQEYFKHKYECDKEKIIECVKEWYNNNKEHRQQYMKEYNEKKKETLTKNKKEYYIEHHDEIKNQKKEIIICECGCTTTRGHISRHKLTKKHLSKMSPNQ